MIDNCIKTQFIEIGESVVDEDKHDHAFSLSKPSNASIKNAGKRVRKYYQEKEYDENNACHEQDISSSIQLIEKYRDYHNKYKLEFQESLVQKLLRLGLLNSCIVSSRTKRMPSIIKKLIRQPSMSLAMMEDLIGIRIIFPDMDSLNAYLKDEQDKCEIISHDFSLCLKQSNRNYIESPKSDGYRGIHQIFKKEDIKLELQIRTQIQHEWATAIEIFGSVKNTQIKIGKGDDKEKKFFKLCSALLAYEENLCVVDEFKSYSKSEICNMLEELEEKLKILSILEKQKESTSKTSKFEDTVAYYLLELNIKEDLTKIYLFNKLEQEKAQKAYSELENKYKDNNEMDVVLVSIDDVNISLNSDDSSDEKLKKAYPNYFLNAENFVLRINKILSQNR